MSPVRGAALTVKVKPDAAGIIAAARVIAKHLNAMADELEALGTEVMPSAVSEDR